MIIFLSILTTITMLVAVAFAWLWWQARRANDMMAKLTAAVLKASITAAAVGQEEDAGDE